MDVLGDWVIQVPGRQEPLQCTCFQSGWQLPGNPVGVLVLISALCVMLVLRFDVEKVTAGMSRQVF